MGTEHAIVYKHQLDEGISKQRFDVRIQICKTDERRSRYKVVKQPQY